MWLLDQNRIDDALAYLAPALEQWARKEMPGVILQSGPLIIPVLKLALQKGVEADFTQRVLSLFGMADEVHPIQIFATNETLTPREVEVLRLITRGASNREIAAELVVSLNTVKSHVTRVPAKLGANSRTHAAARARELGI